MDSLLTSQNNNISAGASSQDNISPIGAAGMDSISQSFPPVLFVHGQGDSSALWITTLWRFESAGYPKERLFTIDFTNPKARDDDTKPQPNRSGTTEQRNQLEGRVREILASTRAEKVVLVANSRGGYSVRNYIKNCNGVAAVSKAVLCGVPNHGAVSLPFGIESNNEFNGAGNFLKELNRGSEVVPGVEFLTIRSDRMDKFAQPCTLFDPIGTGYESPELKGAINIVLDNLDHRETAYHPRAFYEIFKFIVGTAPSSTEINCETSSRLSGLVTGFINGDQTNIGVEEVTVSIFEVDPTSGARIGEACYLTITGQDGAWGVFEAESCTYYEFELKAPGHPVRHFFRSPFPRSSSVIMLRLYEDVPVNNKGVVFFNRPRGYIAAGRDQYMFDGKPLPNVPGGVPTKATFRIEMEGSERPVPVSLNGENMTVRSIPGELVYAEFHY